MTRAAMAHEARNRRRQLGGAARARGLAVGRLLGFHVLDDAAAAQVRGRQPVQMAGQVALDLRFGLGHEAQADGVAEHGRGGAQPEGAQVPERIEQAGPRSEFAQAGLAPGKMIGFLIGGALEELARGWLERDSAAWPRYSPWAAISPA